MDDARLVELARKGSASAAEELFTRYWLLAWKVAYAVTGDRVLADDIAQEAIHQAFLSLETFDVARPFAPWLRRIAANRAIDHLRRERRTIVTDQPAETADARGGDEAGADRVLEAVAGLSPDRRMVILLRYWLDLSLEEIAELLGIPFGTVASRLSRAHADLRTLLKEDENDVA